MEENTIIDILKNEMKPGLGVTEPASIALACAKAYECIGGNVEYVEITLDKGLLKNGYSCGIPGTDKIGNEYAAALGVICGDSSLGLQVLKNIKEEDILKAEKIKDKIKVLIKDDIDGIYVESNVKTNKGHAKVLIRYSHSNIVLVEKNENTIYEKNAQSNNLKDKKVIDSKAITNLSLKDIVDFTEKQSFENIKFVLQATDMNMALARAGIKGQGVCLGKMLYEKYLTNHDDYELYGEVLTTSAVDARVAGAQLPAMTITGSGNHGIITTMPLLAVYKIKNLSKEKLARSIVLSYLVNIYIKEYSGKLSAFCGCAVAAGTGAAAGITYLFGGNTKQIEYAISNMASNITGMICTGGNLACSLKANTGVKAAFLSANMAISNRVINNNCGIVANTVEETMINIGKIAYPGMIDTDKQIVNIMIGK